MTKYDNWTREQLIERLAQIETKQELPKVENATRPRDKKEARVFNLSNYAQQKIALKFCYHGWEYNGLAFQTEPTPLPTVEEVLFDALCHARLIDREAGFEGCDWSRCGRTDRGVSAAGQVVALRVRSSNRPIRASPTADNDETTRVQSTPSEIRYLQVLNRVLPPSIRVFAWSPVKSDFSARFNCHYRHYKYFFDSLPSPSVPLDISKMQDAANRLVGTHDFRNFCKLDGSKQIENYDRRVTSAEISQINNGSLDGQNPLYVFDLVGSAFLWHQVRHIMAVLFLVGQGLEQPSIIDALLNGDPESPNPDPQVPILEGKPMYDMAEGLPLMLWDCGFDEADVQWRTDDGDGSKIRTASSSTSTVQLLESMHSSLTSSLVQASLLRHFLTAAEVYHKAAPDRVVRLQGGGGRIRHVNQYVPLLKRQRNRTPAEVNYDWKHGRGVLRSARRLEKANKLSAHTEEKPKKGEETS